MSDEDKIFLSKVVLHPSLLYLMFIVLWLVWEDGGFELTLLECECILWVIFFFLGLVLIGWMDWF
jgi:hypothetical protein